MWSPFVPEYTKALPEGGLEHFFRGVVGPCFCWGFWRKRVVGCGFLVLKLRWIAGESWEVDGQFSGSKNMPPFPDLFLRDSHFGNLVQTHPLCLGERLRQGYRRRPVPPPVPRGGKDVIKMKATPKAGKVSSINLVDETCELMVICQFGKIIRTDTKSMRSAGRSTRAPSSSTLE
jgi:hypothetical protein